MEESIAVANWLTSLAKRAALSDLDDRELANVQIFLRICGCLLSLIAQSIVHLELSRSPLTPRSRRYHEALDDPLIGTHRTIDCSDNAASRRQEIDRTFCVCTIKVTNKK